MELDDDLGARLNASAPARDHIDAMLIANMSRAARRQVITRRSWVGAASIVTAAILGTSTVAVASTLLSGTASVSEYGQSVNVAIGSEPQCNAMIALKYPTGDKEKDAATIANIEASAQAWLSDLTLTDEDLSAARKAIGDVWNFGTGAIDEDSDTTLLVPAGTPDPDTVARIALAHKFDEWLQNQVSTTHVEVVASDVMCSAGQ